MALGGCSYGCCSVWEGFFDVKASPLNTSQALVLLGRILFRIARGRCAEPLKGPPFKGRPSRSTPTPVGACAVAMWHGCPARRTDKTGAGLSSGGPWESMASTPCGKRLGNSSRTTECAAPLPHTATKARCVSIAGGRSAYQKETASTLTTGCMCTPRRRPAHFPLWTRRTASQRTHFACRLRRGRGRGIRPGGGAQQQRRRHRRRGGMGRGWQARDSGEYQRDMMSRPSRDIDEVIKATVKVATKNTKRTGRLDRGEVFEVGARR